MNLENAMLNREAGSSADVASVALLEDESTDEGARGISVQNTVTGVVSILLGGCSISIASLAE